METATWQRCRLDCAANGCFSCRIPLSKVRADTYFYFIYFWGILPDGHKSNRFSFFTWRESSVQFFWFLAYLATCLFHWGVSIGVCCVESFNCFYLVPGWVGWRHLQVALQWIFGSRKPTRSCPCWQIRISRWDWRSCFNICPPCRWIVWKIMECGSLQAC